MNFTPAPALLASGSGREGDGLWTCWEGGSHPSLVPGELPTIGEGGVRGQLRLQALRTCPG
jgi:hypothetical protein